MTISAYPRLETGQAAQVWLPPTELVLLHDESDTMRDRACDSAGPGVDFSEWDWSNGIVR